MLTENYRQVLGDCADALTLNPVSIKALFRASSALLLMEKYAEAIDCAGRGLTIPGEEANKSLREIVDKATKRKEVKERREGERNERARRETEGRQALSLAFQVRPDARQPAAGGLTGTGALTSRSSQPAGSRSHRSDVGQAA